MKGIIIETDMMSLGNVEKRMVGLDQDEYQIKCIYDGKFDSTAFSMCLKKLQHMKVDNITFQGIPDKYQNERLEKTIKRHYKGSYKFIEDKKVQVEMYGSELLLFEDWKKNRHKIGFDLSTSPDIVATSVIKKDGTAQVVDAVRKEPPANFKMDKKKIVLDQDGIEIKLRSKWTYNKTLCTSDCQEVIVKEVTKHGVRFIQGMKLPRYSISHFGKGKAFERYTGEKL